MEISTVDSCKICRSDAKWRHRSAPGLNIEWREG
jgi:hypothetical protein